MANPTPPLARHGADFPWHSLLEPLVALWLAAGNADEKKRTRVQLAEEHLGLRRQDLNNYLHQHARTPAWVVMWLCHQLELEVHANGREAWLVERGGVGRLPPLAKAVD